MNSDQNVYTEIGINTNQIKFLIDAMWSLDSRLSQQIATRHGINDVELERHLHVCLGSALSEIN